MPIQTILIGNYANDGTGDDLRTAFEKVNANFSLLTVNDTVTATNLGSGTGIFAQKNTNSFEFKSLVAGGGVSISSNGTTITITSQGALETETSPRLGGDLDLNGYNIVGLGDIQATVYGIDVRTLQASSGQIDFGSFTVPAAYDIDLGSF
jgi:hypothetical protein